MADTIQTTAGPGTNGARPAHPLEPLSAEEIARAAALVKESGQAGERPRFNFVTLREPSKEALAGGGSVEREAFAVVLDRASGTTYEAVVSLTAGEVRSCEAVPGVQPTITVEEFVGAADAVRANAEWQEAVRKRGITDFENVQVDPWSAGRFGVDVEDRRIVRGVSYYRESPTDNGYARPIENLIAFVDLNTNEVVRIEDHGVVPVPPLDAGNYDQAAVGAVRTDLKPLDITQPEGPSFVIDGHEVRWQKWRLRISMHPIEGLVLHTVGYEDRAPDGTVKVRPILHRASISDMVVPYGETSPQHRWKNAFDAGEYGLGKLTNSLTLGCDCLGEIRYFDAVMVDEDGNPAPISNAICMHEEDYGVLWKHTDYVTEASEVRRSRRLVISAFHTVGNYEYGFFWYFYQDGTIQLEVKLTGIIQTMAVEPGTLSEFSSPITPQLAGPNHQHLFSFRLDFDLDGTANSVYEVEAEPLPPGPDNELGNAFRAKSTLLSRESEAQRLTNESRARYWKVVNPAVTNAAGQPVAYRLMPGGMSPVLFAQPDSSVAKRAAFATKSLWVTAYAPDELHAAGDYPNLHAGGDGLPKWTAADRPLEDADVVLWYTLSTTHFPRPEDWPVMPMAYTGFTLSPLGFFDRNPALDVPASAAHCHGDAVSGNGHAAGNGDGSGGVQRGEADLDV